MALLENIISRGYRPSLVGAALSAVAALVMSLPGVSYSAPAQPGSAAAAVSLAERGQECLHAVADFYRETPALLRVYGKGNLPLKESFWGTEGTYQENTFYRPRLGQHQTFMKNHFGIDLPVDDDNSFDIIPVSLSDIRVVRLTKREGHFSRTSSDVQRIRSPTDQYICLSAFLDPRSDVNVNKAFEDGILTRVTKLYAEGEIDIPTAVVPKTGTLMELLTYSVKGKATRFLELVTGYKPIDTVAIPGKRGLTHIEPNYPLNFYWDNGNNLVGSWKTAGNLAYLFAPHTNEEVMVAVRAGKAKKGEREVAHAADAVDTAGAELERTADELATAGGAGRSDNRRRDAIRAAGGTAFEEQATEAAGGAGTITATLGNLRLQGNKAPHDKEFIVGSGNVSYFLVPGITYTLRSSQPDDTAGAYNLDAILKIANDITGGKPVKIPVSSTTTVGSAARRHRDITVHDSTTLMQAMSDRTFARGLSQRLSGVSDTSAPFSVEPNTGYILVLRDPATGNIRLANVFGMGVGEPVIADTNGKVVAAKVNGSGLVAQLAPGYTVTTTQQGKGGDSLTRNADVVWFGSVADLAARIPAEGITYYHGVQYAAAGPALPAQRITADMVREDPGKYLGDPRVRSAVAVALSKDHAMTYRTTVPELTPGAAYALLRADETGLGLIVDKTLPADAAAFVTNANIFSVGSERTVAAAPQLPREYLHTTGENAQGLRMDDRGNVTVDSAGYVVCYLTPNAFDNVSYNLEDGIVVLTEGAVKGYNGNQLRDLAANKPVVLKAIMRSTGGDLRKCDDKPSEQPYIAMPVKAAAFQMYMK